MDPLHVSDLMMWPEPFEVLAEETEVDLIPCRVRPTMFRLHVLAQIISNRRVVVTCYWFSIEKNRDRLSILMVCCRRNEEASSLSIPCGKKICVDIEPNLVRKTSVCLQGVLMALTPFWCDWTSKFDQTAPYQSKQISVVWHLYLSGLTVSMPDRIGYWNSKQSTARMTLQHRWKKAKLKKSSSLNLRSCAHPRNARRTRSEE